MFCRVFGLPTAVPSWSSPGMLLEMVWTIFYTVLGDQAGQCSVDVLTCVKLKVVLSRHALGDGLDDFLHFLGDQARPCSFYVLACLQLCQGVPLQACFWVWFGRFVPGVG